jgi:translation initiation factor IF-1
MAANNNKQVVTGIVVEALPNTLFRVKLDVPKESQPTVEGEQPAEEAPVLLAFLAGKMLLNRIRVVIGDRVSMELDPYGGKARIVRRM